jgi:hypothetical protein
MLCVQATPRISAAPGISRVGNREGIKTPAGRLTAALRRHRLLPRRTAEPITVVERAILSARLMMRVLRRRFYASGKPGREEVSVVCCGQLRHHILV